MLGKLKLFYVKNASDVWTSFAYNVMGEQTGATDALGHTTISEYDQLGRRISRLHPDAGLTTYNYYLVGNLAALQTTGMREAGVGAVTYSYEADRRILQNMVAKTATGQPSTTLMMRSAKGC